MSRNYSPSTIDRIADLVMGIKVDKAAIAIAGVSTKSLFTVAGGKVLVLGLIGEVTVIIQNQANNTKFVSTPTTGTAVDLCTTTSIANLEAGGLIALPAATGSALTKGNAGGLTSQLAGAVVPIGTIGINTAADNTGNMKFSLWYVPLDDGAYVTAA
jgi:hypothetical protein